MKCLARSLALILGLFALSPAAFGADSTPADLVASAMAAAPPSITAHAAVMTLPQMTVLRQGTNGWTCFPDDPGSPGKDPMCTDANGMAWMQALMAHRAPPAGKAGMAYMLAGGSDASNLDPYAAKPASGAAWVTTGPHVMILGADIAESSGYPSGQANPDTSRPYVMYGGTPYAHIMMPVK